MPHLDLMLSFFEGRKSEVTKKIRKSFFVRRKEKKNIFLLTFFSFNEYLRDMRGSRRRSHQSPLLFCLISMDEERWRRMKKEEDEVEEKLNKKR